MPSDASHPIDLSSPASAARARAVFLRIAAAWGLDRRQAGHLLGLSAAAYATWAAAPSATLSPAMLQRLSYVFGIHTDLAILLPEAGRGPRWLRQPNAAAPFEGRTALEYLLEGDVDHLAAVRAYLAGQLA